MVMNVAASAPVVSAARSDVSERRARRRRLWRGRRHGREGVGPSAYCPLHVATKAGLHGLRVVYCTPHPARPPKDFLSFDLVGNHSHILGIPVRNSFVRAPEISLAICPPSLPHDARSSDVACGRTASDSFTNDIAVVLPPDCRPGPFPVSSRGAGCRPSSLSCVCRHSPSHVPLCLLIDPLLSLCCAENILGACVISVVNNGKLVPPVVLADEKTGQQAHPDQGTPHYLPDGRSVSFESSFTWHDVDLRTPMPSLAELHVSEHQIGILDGKCVYLCTAHHAARKFGVVEKSSAFSDYYGEKMYICRRA